MWAAFLGDGGRSANNGDEHYVSVHEQFSCLDAPTESAAIDAITRPFRVLGPLAGAGVTARASAPEFLVVEDQPMHMRWDATAKAVARMQGRIVQRMQDYGAVDRLLFVQPAVWQHALGVWRKTPQEVAAVAAGLGYAPPELLVEHEARYKALKGKDRQQVRAKLKKIETDYVDAFCIYAWAVQIKSTRGNFDGMKAVQRYER
jgi:hypothetical protein